MIKQLPALLLGVCALVACQPNTTSAPTQKAGSAAVAPAANPPRAVRASNPGPAAAAETPPAPADSAAAEYETYYVVVADTSLSYAALHRKMLTLNQQFAIGIDTLGRYYDPAKNRIILPDTSSDEMYAGEYTMRRFPAHSLSLEYLEAYQSAAGKQTIALITGIYEREATADSALAVLRPASRNVFKIKSSLFVGCLH
ncbi:hypothetical protein LGH70_06360 [Hymenobacter sp. BT635]|uniref:Uncharacterized protein n=1 Tax=Hymenobacter nitidus TaxID=2880929 RepID=A0ABS8AB85_9BACT|nr:hypothetical protein [Hymenobacter nitidus]MCB2377197.1 hypothetical protein [Hymenobacter nitidus]